MLDQTEYYLRDVLATYDLLGGENDGSYLDAILVIEEIEDKDLKSLRAQIEVHEALGVI